MAERKGKFIVFEGLDGSGKSTQIKRAEAYISGKGFDVVRMSEPQEDRPTGKLLREILSGKEKSDPRLPAAMFAADRIDHITRKGGIAELLSDGKYVLSDRFYISSYAYNSLYTDLDWVMALNSQAAAICRPDLHIFIDVPVDVSLSRLANRKSKEIYERRGMLEKIYANYHRVIDMLSGVENIAVIDGRGDQAEVFGQVKKAIDSV
ncbi:MAG: dTMP kinase [Clostridia bacterium]|nr:dTMP kinase [Clostridia bacterium]